MISQEKDSTSNLAQENGTNLHTENKFTKFFPTLNGSWLLIFQQLETCFWKSPKLNFTYGMKKMWKTLYCL